jgi:hypothetical protein
MAGAAAERQETGVVNKVNSAVRKNQKNPVTVVSANGTKLGKIIKASKYSGRQVTGSEPYIDVIFEQVERNKIKKIGLSLKGESAPSLAGGGLRGINLAAPGLAKKFMTAARKKLLDMGLDTGDKVPDVYGEIRGTQKKKIVVGNKDMGGPIDYMYIGPMSVIGSYDDKKNILKLNGNIIDAEYYAKSHKLYFRLRARREDQRFDPDAFDNAGIPKVYGKSPSRGDSAGRIVVTDSTPNNAVIVKI